MTTDTPAEQAAEPPQGGHPETVSSQSLVIEPRAGTIVDFPPATPQRKGVGAKPSAPARATPSGPSRSGSGLPLSPRSRAFLKRYYPGVTRDAWNDWRWQNRNRLRSLQDIERIIEGQDTRPTALYRLTTNGEAIKLADGLRFTNGIAYDPGHRRFYCNSTFDSTRAFDVGDDLSLSNQSVFLDKEDCDGMALDAEGNVWITGFRSNFLARVRPDGSELPKVETPAGSITQVRFGGPDMRDYYINSVPADGGDTLKEGGELTSENSFLFRGRSEVPGMVIEPSNFKLG